MHTSDVRDLLLLAALVVTLLEAGLALLNLRHLARKGHQVPPALTGAIDAATLERANRYTKHRQKFGLVSTLASRGALLLVVFGGGLAAYDRWLRAHLTSFTWLNLVFVLGAALGVGLFSVPFALYGKFVIEARHGFNRMSFGMWLGDFAKGAALSLVLLSLLTLGALQLVSASPEHWWLWGWALLLAVSVLLTLLAPHLIEPLFMKVSPLSVTGLEPEIQALAERAGVHVRRVFQVDASRRSGHSNAYFTGIGPVKRVVLFDTLLAQMSHGEILAILAHELGHWKHRHILKRLFVGQALALATCYAAFVAVTRADVPAWIFAQQGSLGLRVAVVAFALGLIDAVIAPLFSYWSRQQEREADRFAANLTQNASALATGLAKLARENLSNLHPHPWVAAIYGSHPRVSERVETLTLLAAREAS